MGATRHQQFDDEAKVEQSAIYNAGNDNKIYTPSQHRGKGLGQAMYEATYAHMKGKEGIKAVHHGVHSTTAGHVIKKLAQKHGLGYNPKIHTKNPDPEREGVYDDRYGPAYFKLNEVALEKNEKNVPSIHAWLNLRKGQSF